MRIRAVAVAAVLATLSGLAAPARAADPALVAAFERHLPPIEKAVLAAVLTIPSNAAEFDGDMREAQMDAAGLAAAVAKWRLRMAEFSQRDRAAPNPDLEGSYKTYPEMLSPAIRSYLARRMRDLRDRGGSDAQAQEAFVTLRDYLASVQESLDDDRKLSWYTKKVVAGIMDKYRSELVEYLGTENARRALRDGPGAAAELARRRAAAADLARREEEEERRRQASAQPPPKPRTEPKPEIKPDPKPDSQPLPQLPAPVVTETDAQRTAREQAEAAERTARAGRPGQVFDGGGLVVGPEVTPVVPGPGDTASRGPVLARPGSPAGNLAGPSLTPPPMSDDDVLLESIKGPRGDGRKSWKEYTPHIGGAAVGALLGFLLGGPIGALVGAFVGLAAGTVSAKVLFK